MKRPPPHIVFMLIGFLLVTLGVVLPYLMVMRILPSTYFLNFLSYTSTVAGLLLGVVGSATYVIKHKKKP